MKLLGAILLYLIGGLISFTLFIIFIIGAIGAFKDPNHLVYGILGIVSAGLLIGSIIAIKKINAKILKIKGYDLKDPQTNILFGLNFLSRLMYNFPSPALALAAYNAGPGKAEEAIEFYPETKNYISRVLAVLELFEQYS